MSDVSAYLDRFAQARSERLARKFERGGYVMCCRGSRCAKCREELDLEIDNNPYLYFSKERLHV